MGYNTGFTGQVTITPPLGPDQIDRLKAFAEARHDIFERSPWCKWEPTADGTAIAWNGHEKFYYGDLWMEHLITTFLAPWGHVVNGVIEAEGDEEGDLWRIEVRDNAVYVVRLLRYPDHEEIDPSDPGDWGDEQWARFKAATLHNYVFTVHDGRVDAVGPAGDHGFTPIQEQTA